jgi:hypothetical protein
VRFVQQSILYQLTNRRDGQEVDAFAILNEARIARGSLAVAVAPLLYCGNAEIRRAARKLFPQAIGCGCRDGQPDFSHFRDHVMGAHQRPAIATPLKRALFETAPNSAFIFFASEAERSDHVPYLRKERIISNALYEKHPLGGIPAGNVDGATAGALRDLAMSQYWWSRMFVAEIMTQNKEFRDAEVIKRLREDENELVRHSIAAIDRPDSLRAAHVDQ